MNKLITFILFTAPLVAHAGACLPEFDEKVLFVEITKGQTIYFPFMNSYLIDGKYEPELKTETLDRQSLSKITNILKRQFKHAKSRGSEKIIKNQHESTSVIYRGLNSGYNIEYKFKKINGCWLLVGFANWST